MTRISLINVGLLAGLLALPLSACAGAPAAGFTTPYGQTTMTQPPPPIQEHIPSSPGDNYGWVPGYWGYAASGYVWMPGHYALRGGIVASVPIWAHRESRFGRPYGYMGVRRGYGYLYGRGYGGGVRGYNGRGRRGPRW